MKWAFKVSRNIPKNKVLVSNLQLVPDDTEPVLVEGHGLVEILHVYDDKEEARSSRSWEVVAAHFHHFTPRHLLDILTEDIARAHALGVSEKTLCQWAGINPGYPKAARRNRWAEPRRTANIHILVGQLEKLVERARKNLDYDMRPYGRSH